jgi:carboxyl-terminal processing protease
MNPRRFPLGSGVLLAVTLLAGGWFLRQGIAQERGSTAQSGLLQEVVDHISARYVEPVNRDSLYLDAVYGVLDGLGDPNTSLMSVDVYENFRIQTEGDYGGVGLEIDERDDHIIVVAPIPGTPAMQAGLRSGDLIVEVGEESTRGWPVQRAVQVLRGPEGTDIGVKVQRMGVDELIDFTLRRERIQLHAVPFASLIDGEIGYIPLGLFSEAALAEVQAAADSLQRDGATAFILDLRGNPGGILDQGVGIADLFLGQGLDIVETRGQEGRSNGRLRASSPDRYPGLPVIVLVDRGSASASEIVAGALQDHDRALILGAATYGKGSVQSLYPLSGGYVLKLTTARWHTPQGRSIERIGSGQDTVEELLDSGINPDAEEHLAINVFGRYTLPADTTGRPTVTSVAGRTLYGGGGIVPDLLVPMDTLSTTEQEAVRALANEPGFALGVFNYAVEYLNRNGEDRNFQVTDAHLDEFYGRLRTQRGMTLDLETFRVAAPFVRFSLEAEIAAQEWGEEGAFGRRLPYDTQLRTALELLKGASSPGDLLQRVSSATP